MEQNEPQAGKGPGTGTPINPSVYRSADQKLGDFFDGDARQKSFSDFDFQQISTALKGGNRHKWSKVPRIYTVLRIMGHLQALDDFIDEGITDIWFPFTTNKLPKSLGSSLQTQFLDTQNVVYTKGLSLENSAERAHAIFGRNERLPFLVQGSLGEGAHGRVHKIMSLTSGRTFARKEFRRVGIRNSAREIQSFVNELQILKRLHHEHCVELIASYSETRYFGIIMSPVADCNLLQFYKLAGSEQGKQAILRSFFGCLAAGLAYLHTEKVRHRDIKPQNILVKGDRVYLTDFGVSLDWIDRSRSTTTEDSAKTWIYCAPEVANFEKRNNASDIWSLGCVFLEMVTILKGSSIEDMRQHLKQTGLDHWFFKNPERIQSWIGLLQCRSLDWDNAPTEWVTSMLKTNPSQRPKAIEVKETIDTFKAANSSSPVSFCAECCEVVIEHSDESGSEDGATVQTPTDTGFHEAVPESDVVDANDQINDEDPVIDVMEREAELWCFAFGSISAKLDEAYKALQYKGVKYLPSTRLEITLDGEKMHTTSVQKKTLDPYWRSPFSCMVKVGSAVKLTILNCHVTHGPESFGVAYVKNKVPYLGREVVGSTYPLTSVPFQGHKYSNVVFVWDPVPLEASNSINLQNEKDPVSPQDNSHSKGSPTGADLAALATAGLGAFAGKKLPIRYRSRSRSRDRNSRRRRDSPDSYDSRSPPPARGDLAALAAAGLGALARKESFGRSRSRERDFRRRRDSPDSYDSRSPPPARVGLAALATAGLGVLAGKKIPDGASSRFRGSISRRSRTKPYPAEAGLAALAAAGLGTSAAKEVLDRSRSRSPRRCRYSSDSYDSRSPSRSAITRKTYTPTDRREVTPPQSSSSITNAGTPITTYKVTPDPTTVSGSSVRERSRTRRSTLDSRNRPPAITTTYKVSSDPISTRGNTVRRGSPIRRSTLDNPYSSDEDYFPIPASTRYSHHHRKR